MPDDSNSYKENLNAILRERAKLIEQIKINQQTIDKSEALIRRLDEMLAKLGEKP